MKRLRRLSARAGHPATRLQVYHNARGFRTFSSSFPPARGRIPHRRAALAATLATGNIGTGNTSTLATLSVPLVPTVPLVPLTPHAKSAKSAKKDNHQ